MANRPILFSAPMVCAILREIENPGSGKTQTRRVLKPQPSLFVTSYRQMCDCVIFRNDPHGLRQDVRAPVEVGDRLWVREAWRTMQNMDGAKPSQLSPHSVEYLADNEREIFQLRGRKRSGIHMPRWASRITLTVTDVRAQRVQDISMEDAIAEGCPGFVSADQQDGETPQEEFQNLWNSLNEARGYGWGANPWVYAITFTPKLRNTDRDGRE